MRTSSLPAQICKISSAISYLLLIVTLIWFFVTTVEPSGTYPWPMLAIKLIPLLMFMPGLIQGSGRTHAWLCFVVLVYFTLGILELFSLTSKLEGALITLFSTILFISSTLYIRWHKST
ncbi:MAG: DUF2069 domain-containing protein [Pseudomonadales bacterium]|nr:DUF2069 domain-containing protein [Pseudomonadales bacterium]